MVSQYPLSANEQSWDGVNYNVQDGSGQRGTITFCDGWCVGAFRNEDSGRLNEMKPAIEYFKGAPEEVMEIAKKETLQYLLDEVEGEVIPLITTSFLGKETLYSNDSVYIMEENGMDLIDFRHWDMEHAKMEWKVKRVKMNAVCLWRK